MLSSGLREAKPFCLEGCCPNPIFKGLDLDSDKPKSRSTTSSSTCRHNFAATTASSFFPNTVFTNHESIPCLQESFIQFIKAYPKYSEETSEIDQIRAQEYYQLSITNHVCLDYIGIGLFSQAQTQETSIVPVASTSQLSDFPLFGVTYKSVDLKSELLHGGQGLELDSAIKKRIMEFLNISQDDYSMVFTANRSSAFKLVAETYPFQSGSRKLLTVYDHQSEALEAMTSTAEKRGSNVMSAEFKWPRLRIHYAKLRKMILKKKKNGGLFVFPLRSRMTGASYYYQWMTLAQENGWHVLLDAAALGPKDMDSLGLSLFKPDFLICSFYKVFGENPTGFGCLFVKKSTVPILDSSTSTGIVSVVAAKHPSLHFPEDSSGTDTELEQHMSKLGTKSEGISPYTGDDKKEAASDLNRLECDDQISHKGNINVQCRCLDQVDSLGLMVISNRGRYLINWLVCALLKLHHPNRLDNVPLVTIYGPKIKFDRGPALAFNLYDWKGEKVDPLLVQKLADRSNISVSHGFLHHIWFSEKYGDVKKLTIMERKSSQEKQTSRRKDEQPGITVVSITLTFLANFEDVYRLWAFIAQFLDADFVEKERWRYTALNQKTIQVL